jgi:hypothetical protein
MSCYRRGGAGRFDTERCAREGGVRLTTSARLSSIYTLTLRSYDVATPKFEWGKITQSRTRARNVYRNHPIEQHPTVDGELLQVCLHNQLSLSRLRVTRLQLHRPSSRSMFGSLYASRCYSSADELSKPRHSGPFEELPNFRELFSCDVTDVPSTPRYVEARQFEQFESLHYRSARCPPCPSIEL